MQLQKARKRGYIWGFVRNLELAHGDVDNIVITPRGVIALDSKWKFRALDRRRLGVDLEKAQKAARRTRSILRSKPNQEVHDVTLLLVLWGKGRRNVAVGGEIHDRVRVVDGAELVDLLAAWGAGRLPEDAAGRTLAALEHLAATHGPSAPPPEGASSASRTGLMRGSSIAAEPPAWLKANRH